MWVVFHPEDEERVRIDNISNPVGVKRLNRKEQWLKDYNTMISAIEVIWDNKPPMTDKEESRLIRGLAKKYEQILKIHKR
jgi:hypothetical protein